MRLPKDQLKNRYLSKEEITLAKRLFKEGGSYRGIARIVGTSHPVIMWHLNSEYRESCLANHKLWRENNREREVEISKRYCDRVTEIMGTHPSTQYDREHPHRKEIKREAYWRRKQEDKK